MNGKAERGRPIARLRVAGLQLFKSLGLPEGTVLVSARVSHERDDELELVIAHDDLPATERGALIREVRPTVRFSGQWPEFQTWD